MCPVLTADYGASTRRRSGNGQETVAKSRRFTEFDRAALWESRCISEALRIQKYGGRLVRETMRGSR
jgi:hypothetical protein